MATFTMELNEVIESLYNESIDADEWEQPYTTVIFNDVTYGKLPTLPEWVSLGLGTYPIFDENYRAVLNGKIVDEYFNREIGTETIDNFTLILRKKMDQIMPYFNQLYRSEQIEYSALDTMKIHSVGQSSIEGTETFDGTTESNAKTDSGARVIGSDFPQTMLAANADYARTGSDTKSDVEVDSTAIQDNESTSNTNTNSDTLVTGYQGIASDLIMRYRSSLLNIDTMVLSELETCFMLVLNNGDEYFTREYGWWI